MVKQEYEKLTDEEVIEEIRNRFRRMKDLLNEIKELFQTMR